MKVQGELVATLLILQFGAVSHLSLLCVGCAMGGSLLGNSQLFSLKKKKVTQINKSQGTEVLVSSIDWTR